MTNTTIIRASEAAKPAAPSTPATAILRTQVEDVARDMSKGWMGQAQISFRSLAGEWSTKYPQLAQQLVSLQNRQLFQHSDETRLAIVCVLHDARGEQEARISLNALTGEKGLKLLSDLDAMVPYYKDSSGTKPVYDFGEKRLHLRAHLEKARQEQGR